MEGGEWRLAIGSALEREVRSNDGRSSVCVTTFDLIETSNWLKTFLVCSF